MSKKPIVAISTDFLTAFSKLPKGQQNKVTTFFNKFRNDPTAPGINFEKIDSGIDKNICSVRIDDTYRGIVVREPESGVYMLLWVDHHDEAYDWAKNKKCSINKTTGSVQVFEVSQVAVTETVTDQGLFKNIDDSILLKIGLPEEQIPLVRSMVALEDLYVKKGSIPEDAYEGLEWLGNGFPVDEVMEMLYPDNEEKDSPAGDTLADALQSDASKKSFVIVEGEDELQAIMQEPLEKWRVFLHPTQRKIVDKNYKGPARVLGGAGTGKTVVAMHRARRLAADPDTKKLLFTTYTKNLAEDIKVNLRKICAVEEMKKMDIINLDAWVSNYLHSQGYEYKIVYDSDTDKIWEDAIAIAAGDLDLLPTFYKDEWVKVVQAQEAYSKEAYAKAPRLGRGVRLDRKKRLRVWDVFQEYQNLMNEKQYRDVETAMYECRKILESKDPGGRYSSIIVDESQDLSPSAFRLLRALAGEEHDNDIFIVGDSHQRIYKNKAILSKCGINIRGRSAYLRINYRTTEEIRKFAFALLNGVTFDDLDDDYDNGKECQSLTHGMKPEIKEFQAPEQELDYIIKKIHELESEGVDQKNICVVARTHKLLDNYIAGLHKEGIKSFEIKSTKTDDRTFEGVRIATMHRVKGLEFDHVFVVAVNKKVLPFGSSADYEDNISLEEFRTAEKCLLYVALTRARKSAYVSCYGGLSEFIV